MILQTSIEIRLKPLANEQVMKTQSFRDPTRNIHMDKNMSHISYANIKVDFKSGLFIRMACESVRYNITEVTL